MGHTDAVWGLSLHSQKLHLLSCSADGTVRLWNPQAPASAKALLSTFTSTNGALATFSLQIIVPKISFFLAPNALSIRKRRTARLNVSLLATVDGTPTSVDFVRDDPNKMVTSYTSAGCVLFDLETGQAVTRLDTDQGVEDSVFGRQINRVISHPTLPLTITAHEDRHIRFYDNHTGKLAHSMVAHLDAVTCLAVDPNGLYLLSGST